MNGASNIPQTRAAPSVPGWADAWLDAAAFAIGLGLAWHFQWESRDLVWSLWLSSLVIGYAMIVWMIFGTGVATARRAWADRQATGSASTPGLGGSAVLLAGGLFMLAFFTVHFGGFHFVHSVFLKAFFPLEDDGARSMPTLAFYGEVVARYWWFLPAAAIAERAAFRLPAPAPAPDISVRAEAIEARKKRNAFGNANMMAPYKNVIRMHLLIFFFAFAHFAKLENFGVYAVVCAVYFFPWSLMRFKRGKV